MFYLDLLEYGKHKYQLEEKIVASICIWKHFVHHINVFKNIF